MSQITPGDTYPLDPSRIGRRDVCYIPTVLAQPVENISKGSHVQFTDHTMMAIRCCDESESHGIIDPFICRGVTPDDMVWVFVNPDLWRILLL